MIAETLLYVSMVQDHGILYAAGYYDGSVWFEFSDDGGETSGTFVAGGTQVEVAAADDEEQPGIELLTTGEIMVTVMSGGATEHWVSRDHGESWSEVT
jgi:hypothetical protein